MQRMTEENIKMRDIKSCKFVLKMCLYAFLPCGHLARCLQCALAFITCPVCSDKVKGTFKVHF